MMNRAQFVVALVVLFVGGVAGGVLPGRLTGASAHAGMSLQDGTRPYPVSFVDWVDVYLKAHFDRSTPSYWVSAGVVFPADGDVKFRLTGECSDDVAGRKFYYEHVPAIRRLIEASCERWQAQGFTLTADDIEVDIKMRQ